MTKGTVLDRSIAVLVPNTDDTGSRRKGISSVQERLHRLHGTSLIYEATTRILQLSSAASYVTACTIFHRFYHQVSLSEMDVWSTAMAATLLAIKTEEVAISLRQVVLAFAHIYRRRRLVLVQDKNDVQRILEHPGVSAQEPSARQRLSEKQALLRELPSMSLSPMGPLWKEWHTAVVEAESRILRQLGFTLYWIPDHHPHKFLLYFIRVLQVDDDKDFAQCAWNYCNDSCRLDLCLHFRSHVIACAAIHLASLQTKKPLPSATTTTTTTKNASNKPWYSIFCGPNHEQELARVANAILGLNDEVNLDVIAASHGFVKSLMPEGSFNDPESFVWEYGGVAQNQSK